jgi:hypothetical protein
MKLNSSQIKLGRIFCFKIILKLIEYILRLKNLGSQVFYFNLFSFIIQHQLFLLNSHRLFLPIRRMTLQKNVISK